VLRGINFVMNFTFVYCYIRLQIIKPENIHRFDKSEYKGSLFFLESHEQFFSYVKTITITGDRVANLDLHVCLALTVFSSKGSFTCNTFCGTGPPFLRSYPKDP
jgi:hypothetical protein